MNTGSEDVFNLCFETLTRPKCGVCLRPLSACYCTSLPSQKLKFSRDLPAVEKIVIFQHPKEISQAFTTSHILQLCSDASCVQIISTRRPSRAAISKLSVLLFPANNAVSIGEYLATSDDAEPLTLILLDATWNFANEMYNSSEWLKSLPCLNLSYNDYFASSVSGQDRLFQKIRSQPKTKKSKNDLQMSTAEAASQLVEAIARVSRCSYSCIHYILSQWSITSTPIAQTFASTIHGVLSYIVKHQMDRLGECL